MVLAADVDVAASINQLAHNLNTIPLNGGIEWSYAYIVRQLHISRPSQQHLYDILPLHLHCCKQSRLLAALISEVDVCPGLQQSATDVSVTLTCCTCKWCLTPIVDTVHGSAPPVSWSGLI